ncbi:DUF2332 domain-containing protein [Kribbella sp. VKM Ac-2568]|uniref:DUF2332 domain-containing protein n=1 Tax=Kribbella sp. VKM Ac-2568 TaxID=2512219 RepID=UPI0010479757|nr:DUF2332 domain-containing protein [Kribbella sp. VKM Ac-2568]TCM41131.1 hypothetical protein EV648_112188 [Kribbella sp. VKM Ac-2568]
MDLVQAFQLQAVACEDLGSPMYADLLRLVVDDYEIGGSPIAVLAGYEDQLAGAAIALRLLGSVHRLVLAGEAPELAAFYPSVGGEWDPRLGWEAFDQVLQARGPELRELLTQPPQTNEVGRSIALYGGLSRLVEAVPLPVRLFEIGASGGLNLRADQFRYNLADGSSFGPSDSPVVFDDAWSGRPLDPAVELRIVERVGSDIAPVNPFTDDGALTLTSYVWPDMPDRLERLRGALEVARKVPADIRREDAVSFLRNLELSEGHVTVVWHSVMWQYLTPEDKAAADGLIAALGAKATPSAPLAHLSLEPMRRTPDAEPEFLVVLQVWPTGVPRVLGTAEPHGLPARWE